MFSYENDCVSCKNCECHDFDNCNYDDCNFVDCDFDKNEKIDEDVFVIDEEDEDDVIPLF